jgi:hypothetical protein
MLLPLPLLLRTRRFGREGKARFDEALAVEGQDALVLPHREVDERVARPFETQGGVGQVAVEDAPTAFVAASYGYVGC